MLVFRSLAFRTLATSCRSLHAQQLPDSANPTAPSCHPACWEPFCVQQHLLRVPSLSGVRAPTSVDVSSHALQARVQAGLVSLPDSGAKLSASLEQRREALRRKTDAAEGRVLTYLDESGAVQASVHTGLCSESHRGWRAVPATQCFGDLARRRQCCGALHRFPIAAVAAACGTCAVPAQILTIYRCPACLPACAGPLQRASAAEAGPGRGGGGGHACDAPPAGRDAAGRGEVQIVGESG